MQVFFKEYKEKNAREQKWVRAWIQRCRKHGAHHALVK